MSVDITANWSQDKSDPTVSIHCLIRSRLIGLAIYNRTGL